VLSLDSLNGVFGVEEGVAGAVVVLGAPAEDCDEAKEASENHKGNDSEGGAD
jgi:hypothetical protein